MTRASLATLSVAALERRLEERRRQLELQSTVTIANGRAAAGSKP